MPPTHNDDYYSDTTTLIKDPTINSSFDIISEEEQTAHYQHRRCGALGDCLGWNSPIDHEAVQRIQLLRRVMLIVLGQLSVVAVMCSIVLFVPQVRDFILDNIVSNSWLFWVMFITAIIFEFGSLIVLFLVRKKFPVNFIVLLVFTISTGYFVAISVSLYSIQIVLEAVIITAIIVVSVVLYTLISRADFKILGAFLFFGLLAFIIWGNFYFLLWIFGEYTYWLNQIYCLIGVHIFTLYIMFDVSRLVHIHPPEEYILAAVSLYLDIINLFLMLLALLGGRR